MENSGDTRPRNKGGRPKGSRTKRTQQIARLAAARGITPVEFMLEIMRNEDEPTILRLDAASRCAPYIHPRLASVTVDATVSATDRTNDILETAKAVAFLMRLAEQGALGPKDTQSGLIGVTPERDGEGDATDRGPNLPR